MAKHLILDVETIGHPDAGNWLDADPIEAPSNYKNPDAIAGYIKAETEKRKTKLGLDIDCNRIVCLGYYDTAADNPVVNVCATEEEERNVLRLFWDQVTTNTRIITFNGSGFDLPVLLMRSLLLNVRHPEVVIAPAWKTPHIDLYEQLKFGTKRQVKGLKFYAKRFEFPLYDDISGADVARLAAENTVDGWNTIANHCASDIAITHLLARKLGVCA